MRDHREETPAEPIYSGSYTGDDGQQHTNVIRGKTLRDYFAGRALEGMLASETEGAMYSPECAADRAYRFADAMIATRDK